MLWTGQSGWLFWRGQPNRLPPGHVLATATYTGTSMGTQGNSALPFFLRKKCLLESGMLATDVLCLSSMEVSWSSANMSDICVRRRGQNTPADKHCETCLCTLKDGSLAVIASQHKYSLRLHWWRWCKFRVRRSCVAPLVPVPVWPGLCGKLEMTHFLHEFVSSCLSLLWASCC